MREDIFGTIFAVVFTCIIGALLAASFIYATPNEVRVIVWVLTAVAVFVDYKVINYYCFKWKERNSKK